MKPLSRSTLAVLLVAGLAACSTTPPMANSDLEAARSAVERARANPYAQRSANVELDAAQKALQRAQAAWADKQSPEEVAHLSYLAKRRADIALAMATQAQAEERVQAAGTERERARLEARTREAENAAAQARAAQATARAAQASAASAQAQAQMSRQEAEAARLAAAQQAERATALERDLQAMEARKTERGMVVTLGDVLFSTGQADLQPGGVRAAQQLADVLRQYPERRVLVEGFTDNVGGDALNQALSQRRAEAFRNALLTAGVAADRIEVRGHGEAMPVADNATAAGRQQNRRVEVLFSDGTGRLAAR